MSNLKRNVNTSAYSKNTVISYRRLRVVLPPTDISYSVRVRTVTDPRKTIQVIYCHSYAIQVLDKVILTA